MVVLPEAASSRYELAAQVGAEVQWLSGDGAEGYLDFVTDEKSMTNIPGLYWVSPFAEEQAAKLKQLRSNLTLTPTTGSVEHE